MNNYEMMKSRESLVEFQVLGAIVVRPWPHHRRWLCVDKLNFTKFKLTINYYLFNYKEFVYLLKKLLNE